MHGLSFMELMKLSYTMPLLLICSVFLVTFALERWWYFYRTTRIRHSLRKKIDESLEKGEPQKVLQLCKDLREFFPVAVKSAIEAKLNGNVPVGTVTSLNRQRFHSLLNKRLGVFGTLSFIAPLLGLLGTVTGIMRAFQDLALSGSAGPAIIAAGISESLITTEAGIAIAVPAAVIYNYFTFRLRNFSAFLDVYIQEVILKVS